MARIRFDAQFDVGELWVAGSVLGSSIAFSRDGFDVQIRLPMTRNDFRMNEMTGFRPGGALGGRSSGTPGTAQHVQTVRVIQVSVSHETAFGAADEAGSSAAVRDYAANARRIATDVATDFVQWARIRRGQSWLGMSHAEPPRVGLLTLTDETASQVLAYGGSEGIVVQPFPISKAVDGALLQDLPTMLGDGHPELPLPDSLVADAAYLIGIRPPNEQQAVLLAAVGLEVAVKAALRRKADPAKLELLDYILTNPRDVAQQALALFDGTMKVAIARSLKDDDRPLFNRLRLLFEKRNAVAHRGEAVSLDEAKDLVAAATQALTWLSGL
jgi:hypothetical protein